MKKILVFTTTFPNFTTGDATPGFVYDLSKRLQKLGLQIVILTPRVPGSKKYEEKDGMKIYRYSYFFNNTWEKLNDGAILPNLKKNKLLFFQVPFLLLAGFLNLIKIIQIENVDTIHAHWIIPQGFLSVLYKRLFNKNIKIVCTSHGSDLNSLNGKIFSAINKFVLNDVDLLTVVSNDIKNKVVNLGINKNKVKVLPMGVDDNLFSLDKYNEEIKKKYNIRGKFLLFVGRISEEKGVEYLIEAMKGIINKYHDTKLLIIGHGTLENELKKQNRKLGLEKNIIFVGAVENKLLTQYYATADIFISPSLNEGFGLVFVEAVLSGCIIIGSRVGGIIDIIENGKTGFLVEEKNIKDIEKKILEVIKNNNFDKQRAREIIKNKFSWDIISKKYFNLLNKL